MLLRLLLLLLLCQAQVSYGQGPPSDPVGPAPALLPVRIPPAPSTAALERYALMPVNEPSGTPNISIPLHEISSGSLTLPLTASYHASGVRVSDKASWVGLGWALSGGGVITRVVRGHADDDDEGYNSLYNAIPSAYEISIETHHNLLDRVADNIVDYQPDLYTYSFPGQGGSFMRDNTGKFQTLPFQPLQIAFREVDSVFVLTDAAGVRYEFGSKERTTVIGRPTTHYTSAWYLNRIISANKSDTIRLEYDGYPLESIGKQQQHTLATSVSDFDNLDSPLQEEYREDVSVIYQSTLKLRRVLFRGGVVELTTNDLRRDNPGDKRLVTLEVRANNQADAIKQVRFYQSYFNQNEPSPEPAYTLRLRLDSIAITSSRVAVPPYRFAYNAIALPHRETGSRDHWGYFNNATGATSPRGTPALERQPAGRQPPIREAVTLEAE